MKDLSERSLTTAYVIALGLVAVMTVASHLTLQQVLVQNQGAASVLNISGRQRMLSQRIASLSAQLALGDETARGELGKAIERFTVAHGRLKRGDEELHLPPATTPALNALYFGGDDSLDNQVTSFIASARAIQELPPNDPRMSAALAPVFAAALNPLLARLDAVVSEHERTSQAHLNRLQWMQNVSLAVVLLTLLAEALGIFRPMVRRIGSYASRLTALASTDFLTGTLNRRSFSDRAEDELAQAKRHGRPTTVLMIDADRFKAINDTYGHSGGDAVLKALAARIAQVLRPGDLCGRLGGEEFAVLLRETGIEGARVVAERIRSELAALKVPCNGEVLSFTVSIGVAEFEAGTTDLKPGLDRADVALYEAKATGRDRVVVHRAPEPSPAAAWAGEHGSVGLATT